MNLLLAYFALSKYLKFGARVKFAACSRAKFYSKFNPQTKTVKTPRKSYNQTAVQKPKIKLKFTNFSPVWL
nr:hypothetical protein [uncultured Campylobacter sp.]